MKIEEFTEAQKNELEIDYLAYLTGDFDLEKHFNVNIARFELHPKNWYLGKVRKHRSEYLQIIKKPASWDNCVFIAERGEDLYYVRKPLVELLPLFGPDDAILPMSPSTLFGLNECDISEITEESIGNGSVRFFLSKANFSSSTHPLYS